MSCRLIVPVMCLLFACPPVACAADLVGAVLAEGNVEPLDVLAQAKLDGLPGTRWVERVEIKRVLAEQQLAAALGASHVRQRVALGRLLKADVLVMLRRSDGGTDVTVAETTQGLRLSRATIPKEQQPEAAADVVAEAVRAALPRLTGKITDICAVPTFVSNDLTHSFAYLRAAYAQLLESMLLEQDGVLVVEFAEAQALAKELALTTGGGVRRGSLPLYVLGEYRNDGNRNNRRVTVTIKVARGDTAVGERTLAKLAPADVPQAMRGAAAELLKQAGLTKVAPPADIARELAALMARTEQYERLGHWAEASDMIEARLLLDPNQPKLHEKALLLLRNICQNYGSRFSGRESVLLAVRYKRRALYHFDAYRHAFGPGLARPMVFRHWPNSPTAEGYDAVQAATAEVAELEKEQRAYFWEVTQERLRAGDNDILEYLARITSPRDEDPWLLKKAQEEPAEVAALLRALRSAPHFNRQPRVLAELSKSTHPELRDAATALAELASARSKSTTSPHAPAVLDVTRPSGVVMKPVDIRVIDENGQPFPGSFSLDRWVQAGDTVDALWNTDSVYLMKRKGELRRVLVARPDRIWDVIHDGRYLWAVLGGEKAQLAVIDPVSEKVWKIERAEGLPHGAIRAAPIAPGEVCLATHRWYAVGTFADGRASFRVIHEAREEAMENDPQQWRRTTVGGAGFLASLRDRAGAVRIVVGRETGRNRVNFHPLIIDVATGTITAYEDEFEFRPHATEFTVHADALYWTEKDPAAPHLFRMTMPDLKKTIALANCPDGQPIFHDGRLWIIEQDNWRDYRAGKPRRAGWPKQWWVAESLGSPLRALWPQLPGGASARDVRLHRTNHYGLLAIAQLSTGGSACYEVELLAPSATNPSLAPTTSPAPR